jgi:hypothetical protein
VAVPATGIHSEFYGFHAETNLVGFLRTRFLTEGLGQGRCESLDKAVHRTRFHGHCAPEVFRCRSFACESSAAFRPILGECNASERLHEMSCQDGVSFWKTYPTPRITPS